MRVPWGGSRALVIASSAEEAVQMAGAGFGGLVAEVPLERPVVLMVEVDPDPWRDDC